MTRFEMRPLGRWARPHTDPRASASRFRADWNSTVKHLLHEVDLLDGHLVAIQVDVADGQVRRDGMLRAGTRIDFPGVKVSFGSRHGPLTYATDAYDHWQANVRAIALALGALRAVDRYGVTGSGEQYRGWTAITAAPAEKALSVDEAARIIAAAVDARPEFVKGFADILVDAAGPNPIVDERSVHEARAAINQLYRKAARTAHPDLGGSADAFRLISSARDVLLGAIRDGAR